MSAGVQRNPANGAGFAVARARSTSTTRLALHPARLALRIARLTLALLPYPHAANRALRPLPVHATTHSALTPLAPLRQIRPAIRLRALSFATTVCAARTFATYPAHSPTPVATPTTARPVRSDFTMDYTLPTTPFTRNDDDRIDARAPDALCAFADMLPTARLPSPLPPMTRYALATRAPLRQYVALSYPHDPLLCARTPRV
ncbi:hypothetical protein C8J57DRAFT_1503394 [Mycena rebaudengoi]|nr:hypothetical protein C8J57DRAFT_1503394 [Mycena rebaudengoi]